MILFTCKIIIGKKLSCSFDCLLFALPSLDIWLLVVLTCLKIQRQEKGKKTEIILLIEQ